jgi:hypothetical protein
MVRCGLDAAGDFQAVDAEEHRVENHQIRLPLGYGLQGLLSAFRAQNLEALPCEIVANQLQDVFFVVHDQYLLFSHDLHFPLGRDVRSPPPYTACHASRKTSHRMSSHPLRPFPRMEGGNASAGKAWPKGCSEPRYEAVMTAYIDDM